MTAPSSGKNLKKQRALAGRTPANVPDSQPTATIGRNDNARPHSELANSELPHSELPDGQIVVAVLAGHRSQFDWLVQRYEMALTRLALSRLGNAALAEEVVQETFLAAFKWLDSYDSRYSFRTWLWTILLNQCHRAAKRLNRQPRVSSWTDCSIPDGSGASGPPSGSAGRRVSTPADMQAVCPAQGPGERAMAREKSEQLEQLLDALPLKQADALRLRFYGGLKFQEIADAMQCSLSTAKIRVREGLRGLATRLTPPEHCDSVSDLQDAPVSQSRTSPEP